MAEDREGDVRADSPVVVVANRLPVDQVTDPDGNTRWQRSPGGLVTALEPFVAGRGGAWVGWAGSPGQAPEPFQSGGMSLIPVPLSDAEVDGYYEGMSNASLWPLYHDVVEKPEYHRGWWDTYVQVNRRFADRTAEVAAEGAIVWVHDYQLQLVPALLRQRRPDVTIGFFLHIPFPPSELFTQLPWRTAVLEGLLGADLVGFQRPAAATNFVQLARRLHDLPARGNLIEYDGRTVAARAFPISIDTRAFDRLAASPEVLDRAAEIHKELGNPERIILGVDRLDYTKGIGVRLQAFEELLEDGVVEAPHTVLVQVATPSRERVEHYVHMREQIEQQVGHINGVFGSIAGPAVHYFNQSMPREELAALYRVADVMLVTPYRDGMNLVAKEYVAARGDLRGALVLSEFAGAAAELKQAFLVNPHDIAGVKNQLVRALRIEPAEAARRLRAMRRHLFKNDLDHWANSFFEALRAQATGPQATGARPAGMTQPDALPEPLADALDGLARRRPLLVASDYDGVLARLRDDPSAAVPEPEVADVLTRLADADGVTVALVSGRGVDDLRTTSGLAGPYRWIGSHGAEFDGPLGGELATRRDDLVRLLGPIVERAPGARLEVKPASVAVHVRQVPDRDVAAALLADASTRADPSLTRKPGKDVLELAVTDADKGTALRRLRDELAADGALYLGDDVTDEDGFRALGRDDVTVKIGDGETAARFRVPDPAGALAVLRRLADLLG